MMNYLQKKKQALLNYVSSGGRLPSEYQEVEWIESTGTQYIDTGLYLSKIHGFDCKFYTKTNIGTAGAIFGARLIGSNRDYQLTSFDAGGTIRWGAGSTNRIGMLKETIQECSLRNGVFIDCNGVERYPALNENPAPVTADLFMLNSNGSHTQGGSGCRLYIMRFYEGNNLVRDFVPCYRKADDVIGLYDLVYGTFYTNAGSGTFTKGQDV